MRESFLLNLILLKSCFGLSVYEPYPNQKDTFYKDGDQTVELTIQNLDYRLDSFILLIFAERELWNTGFKKIIFSVIQNK